MRLVEGLQEKLIAILNHTVRDGNIYNILQWSVVYPKTLLWHRTFVLCQTNALAKGMIMLFARALKNK